MSTRAGPSTSDQAHPVAPTSACAPSQDRAPTAAQPLQRVITIDGPSGSGKSTAARALAARLGWRYVDTGASYRAATLAVLRAGVDLADPDAVTRVVRDLLAKRGLELATDPSCPGVRLDGDDVSEELRGAAVTAAVSAVSAVPAVRVLLVGLQRELLGGGGAVGEGRDVGSVVVPGAPLKVYLDADARTRAARRAGDSDAGVLATGAPLVEAVAADLVRRDHADSTRAASPLAPADDAVHLASDDLTPEQVVDRVLELARATGLV